MTLIHKLDTERVTEESSGYWSVGQRLKVGKIISHKGKEEDELLLQPQGIAHLISEEIIDLPNNVCAFAHVMTRKCNDGLLTLNIGVIDPGWRNHVSTAILNFGSQPRLLKKGDEFLRITFHKIDGPPSAPSKRENEDIASYCSSVKRRASSGFGRHFLNIKKLVSEASKKENERLRDTLLKYIPIAAFSLAFFALMVTVGVGAITRYFATDNSEISKLSVRLEQMEQRIKSQEMRTKDSNFSKENTSNTKRPETEEIAK